MVTFMAQQIYFTTFSTIYYNPVLQCAQVIIRDNVPVNYMCEDVFESLAFNNDIRQIIMCTKDLYEYLQYFEQFLATRFQHSVDISLTGDIAVFDNYGNHMYVCRIYFLFYNNATQIRYHE